MDSTLFHRLCTRLGYDPDRVLRIRIGPRQVVVRAAGLSGETR
jgi:hypothetical protein